MGTTRRARSPLRVPLREGGAVADEVVRGSALRPTRGELSFRRRLLSFVRRIGDWHQLAVKHIALPRDKAPPGKRRPPTAGEWPTSGPRLSLQPGTARGYPSRGTSFAWERVHQRICDGPPRAVADRTDRSYQNIKQFDKDLLTLVLPSGNVINAYTSKYRTVTPNWSYQC